MEKDNKDDFSDLIKGFVAEAREHLLVVENELINLENQGDETGGELVKRLFRAVHSIKGGASFFDFNNIKTLSHHIEGIFGLLRESRLKVSPLLMEMLLGSVDKLKLLINNIDSEAQIDVSEICNNLGVFIKNSETGEVATSLDEKIKIEENSIDTKKNAQDDPVGKREQLNISKEILHNESASPDTVRISVGILDELMNLASELVLVRNQNLQAIETKNFSQLASISQKLNLITSEFQTTAIQTRMQPINTLFGKSRRLVRDMAIELKKEIEIELHGSSVELDKTIIEALGDPLIHIIRNSVDHGIETPSERRAMGKPSKGRIILSARHIAGRVIIDISDDGRGLDSEALLKNAIDKGIITKEGSEKLEKSDIFNFIFTPGFSTAERVTDFSGRGVGMDVVKVSIFKLGGSIDLKSEKGKGTTLSIKLPLTLAIMPALIMKVEDFCFAIPQVSIVEVAWLYGEDVFQKLKMIDEEEVYWIHGKLLPLLRLSKILNIPRTYFDIERKERVNERRREAPDRRERDYNNFTTDLRKGVRERRASIDNKLFIVVLKIAAERFGLVVDEIVDNLEIVVKPLHDQLKSCGIYVGSTVLGNGRISLILDVPSLSEIGKLDFTKGQQNSTREIRSSEMKFPILLFKIGKDEIFAIPIYMIHRIERVKKSDLKRVARREYAPFRDDVIPLIGIENILKNIEANYSDDFFVIIPKSKTNIGIKISEIIDNFDILDSSTTQAVSCDGVLGSMVLSDRLVLFLDMPFIIEHSEKRLFKKKEPAKSGAKSVLILEDSLFFGQYIMALLQNEGINGTWVKNGEEAIKMLNNDTYDLILSDLEMPVMDGFEFACWLRSNSKFNDIKMWALSSATIENIEDKIERAGFNGFQSKGNKEKLKKTILELIKGE